MTRIVTIAAMGLLLSLAIAPVFAQQLQPPATPATPTGQGVGPRLNTARPTPPSSIPADLGHRPPATAPIPSTGPSVPPPAKVVAKPLEPADHAAPRRVLDDRGRYVPGAVQVSPTRAYDPATGRYFPTMLAPKPR